MIVSPFEESNGILLTKSHDHFKGVKTMFWICNEF